MSVDSNPLEPTEVTQLNLAGIYVSPGNSNGVYIEEEGSVLYTFPNRGSVVICGHRENTSFMIHSDSSIPDACGRDLLSSIQGIAPIKNGKGWRIFILGDSIALTVNYLRSRLPNAKIKDIGSGDHAYITQSGVVAKTIEELAGALGVKEVSIVQRGDLSPPSASAAETPSPAPWPCPRRGPNALVSGLYALLALMIICAGFAGSYAGLRLGGFWGSWAGSVAGVGVVCLCVGATMALCSRKEEDHLSRVTAVTGRMGAMSDAVLQGITLYEAAVFPLTWGGASVNECQARRAIAYQLAAYGDLPRSVRVAAAEALEAIDLGGDVKQARTAIRSLYQVVYEDRADDLGSRKQ